MKLNRTAQRTVEILKLASESPDGIALDEICKALQMPKTSAYDIVTTLHHMGMLHMEKGPKQKYTVGLSAYRIGVSYTNHMDMKETIEPELKKLAAEAGKTVFFGILADNEIVYISKAEPENPIITTATVGTKNPVYCTSLGKAILAECDKKMQISVLSQVRFEQRTSRTILRQERFLEELETARKRGYAFDDRELEEHMKCVGSAVYGKDGKVVGAISVSGLYRPDEDYDALGRMVKRRAKEVSALLGYLGKNTD
ncbi:MAG: IclR family transcriptional regulator [bacterium]|nr:IclR family transcriptional regulator [bacterium]